MSHVPQRFDALPHTAGGDAGAARGIPVSRLPARGDRSRRAGLPRRGRRRGRPDRARAADAERRRRAPPFRLEPLLVGVPRPRPLASDHPRLPLVADPRRERRRRSSPADDREGHRAGRGRRRDGLHAPPHRPLHAGRQHRHLDARRRRRKRRRRLRGARREDVRAQGPLGERRRDTSLQLRLLVPAAPATRSSRPSSASRMPTSPASTSTTSRPGGTGAGSTSGTSPSGDSSRRSTSARTASSRSRRAGSTTPTPTRASSEPPCRARCGTSTATTAASRPTR